ncbi:MAG: hypothetical protein P4L81_03450 [Candidatus Pacebacteria bacterium]|nr:hypothetical protein [Candidatus Paceibacterota bacterium]
MQRKQRARSKEFPRKHQGAHPGALDALVTLLLLSSLFCLARIVAARAIMSITQESSCPRATAEILKAKACDILSASREPSFTITEETEIVSAPSSPSSTVSDGCEPSASLQWTMAQPDKSRKRTLKQATLPPKRVLSKPLSAHHPDELVKALKHHRVQMKHLIRVELMSFTEWLLPKKKVNKDTGFPRWKMPVHLKDGPTFEDYYEKRLHARYRALHPKRRHVEMGRGYYADQDAIGKWLWKQSLWPEDPLLQEYYIDPASTDKDAERKRSNKVRSNLFKGKVPVAHPKDLLERLWKYIDNYPSSDSNVEDSTEPECSDDEDGPCQVCFPMTRSDSNELSATEDLAAPAPDETLRPSKRNKPSEIKNSASSASQPDLQTPAAAQRPCQQWTNRRYAIQCKHNQSWNGKAKHLLEFGQFIKQCCYPDHVAEEHCLAKDLFAAYGTWAAAKEREWTIPSLALYKCAQERFCLVRPKGKEAYVGVRLL